MFGQLTLSSGFSHSPLFTHARNAAVVTSVLSRQNVPAVTSCGGFESAVKSRAPINILPLGISTIPSVHEASGAAAAPAEPVVEFVSRAVGGAAASVEAVPGALPEGGATGTLSRNNKKAAPPSSAATGASRR